jgi:hypothetical protein
MATTTKQHAVDLLTEAIKTAYPDDLVEIHNELFPERPTTEDEAKAHPSILIKKIIAHIDKGLEVQEILDLWNVIFPRHRSVRFDEDEGLIHYDEKTQPVGQAD